VSLDALTEDELDTLDRINMNEAGQGIKDNEPVNRQNPQTSGSQGGRPSGSSGGSSQPTTDSLDALSTEQLQRELQRRNET
jgi:hypothetical protein